jgi:hypothetical protein
MVEPRRAPMVLRLDRNTDRERPCCNNLALVLPGTAQHAAALRCVDCNRHRGWLPRQALDFLKTTTNRFGASSAPIVLRDQQIGDQVMEKKQYDNSGILFRVDGEKNSPNDRDYRGELTINGVEFWLSGWVKQGQKGKFLSLSVKLKDPPAAKPTRGTTRDFDDQIPF